MCGTGLAYANRGSGLFAVQSSSGAVYNSTFWNNVNARLSKGYGVWIDTSAAGTWTTQKQYRDEPSSRNLHIVRSPCSRPAVG